MNVYADGVANGGISHGNPQHEQWQMYIDSPPRQQSMPNPQDQKWFWHVVRLAELSTMRMLLCRAAALLRLPPRARGPAVQSVPVDKAENECVHVGVSGGARESLAFQAADVHAWIQTEGIAIGQATWQAKDSAVKRAFGHAVKAAVRSAEKAAVRSAEKAAVRSAEKAAKGQAEKVAKGHADASATSHHEKVAVHHEKSLAKRVSWVLRHACFVTQAGQATMQ